MEIFNDLHPIVRLIVIVVYLLATTVSFTVFLTAPSRLRALQTKVFIDYKEPLITKINSGIFYGTVGIYYLFAINKYGLDSFTSIFIFMMFLFMIYRVISGKVKQKETTKFNVHYGKEEIKNITDAIEKETKDITFILNPNQRVLGGYITSNDEETIKKKIQYLQTREDIITRLSDTEVSKKVLFNKVLYILTGIYNIIAIILLFLITLF